MTESHFYDDLASYHHLIFEDWEASTARQGDAIAALAQNELPSQQPANVWILDAACGIGSQALPLARRGFQLVARDLSAASIDRLRCETASRRLVIDAAQADMCQVAASVSGSFAVVLAFDNSVPHLLTDEDLLRAFGQFDMALRPGGVFMCSVRDYDQVQRGVPATHHYGARKQEAETFHLRQSGPATTQPATKSPSSWIGKPERVLRLKSATVSRYYAISVGRLLELMGKAGFVDCRRMDRIIYQPVLIGRKRS